MFWLMQMCRKICQRPLDRLTMRQTCRMIDIHQMSFNLLYLEKGCGDPRNICPLTTASMFFLLRVIDLYICLFVFLFLCRLSFRYG